jgi:TPR repeat protein
MVAKIHRPVRTQIERLVLEFFVRAVNLDFGEFPSANDAVVSTPDSERTSCHVLYAVKIASSDSRIRMTDCNYLSLNEIPTVGNEVEDVQDICRRLSMLYTARCWLLLVFVVEVCSFSSEGTNSAACLPFTLILFDPTGHVLRVESHVESV